MILSGSLVLAALATAAFADPRLEVSAGLGGFYRPGRWLPVIVTLENHGAEIEGELEAALPPASVSTSVELGAPARKRLELALPAPWTPSALTILLRSRGEGEVLASASITLEPVPRETRLELRVLTREERMFGETAELAGPERARVVSLLPEDVPSRWKALEAADSVLLSRGAEESLGDEQRLALRRRAMRRQEEHASFLDSEPTRASVGGERAAALFGIAYLVLVAALEVGLALARARPLLRLWWTLAIALAFVVLFRGTRPPAIEERSVLRIEPGAAETSVESRIDLDFGRREEASLEATSSAVFFEPAEGEEGLGYRLSADGRLGLPGPWFRWERESLRVQGFAETPFLVEDDRIENRSEVPLEGCFLGSRRLPDVPAGGSVSLATDREADELICESRFRPGLLSFPSEARGTSLVVFRLGPVAAEESMGDH